MATYIGRHNHRRHLVVQGLIRSPERYDRYYDIAWEALSRGVLPFATLPADRLMFRKSDRDIEQSRTIAPAAHSSNSVSVRYSGVRLQGNAGQGALYLASLAALLREHVHYGGNSDPLKNPLIPARAPDQTMLAAKRIMAGQHTPSGSVNNPFHAYRLTKALRLADIRVMALSRLFGGVLATASSRTRFGLPAQTTPDLMVQTVLDPQDYSAARGIADALFDHSGATGLAGLVATSARGDSDGGNILYAHGDGVEGFVYALFGAPGQVLSALTPVASYPSFNALTEAAKMMPGFQWIA